MKNNIKTFILIFVAIVLACIYPIIMIVGVIQEQHEQKAENYALTTIVISLDYENDLVQCEDFNGNLWEFEGCEDWVIGDIASLLMNDRGTEKIYDDTIIDARYSGYFEGWN
jgi:antirestriction protein